MRSFRTFALSLAAAACLVLLAVGLLAGSSQAAAWSSTREYFEMMDLKFTQFTGAPVEVTRGTGFKPYMRYRTFAEPRLDPATGSMTPGARWEVFQQMKAIEQQYGSRSETWFSLGPINVAGRCLAIEVHPTNLRDRLGGLRLERLLEDHQRRLHVDTAGGLPSHPVRGRHRGRSG